MDQEEEEYVPTLLIVEDEVVLARNLEKAFKREGFTVRQVGGAAEAERAFRESRPDIVLLDLGLPDGSGLDVLERFTAEDPEVPVVIVTGSGLVTDAVKAMQRGARDYVQKPLDLDELRLKVTKALRSTSQKREISYYRDRAIGTGDILGKSDAAERLRKLVSRLAASTGGPGAAAPTVLLLGETGSGKGHVARALHAAGGRSGGPFIEVNCTALPENLVEAELFGYEKGAFTDAKTARAGLFETADGGTIFLDEIGHIVSSLQAKFLKAIEEKVVRRIGASAPRKIDVQVIAATNRDLEAAVRLGEFREDLYQRLYVAVIRIPPMRERGDDMVILARGFLADAVRRYAAAPRALSPEAEAAIRAYAWPGNVRELSNTMERVILFSDADPVTVEDMGLPGSSATQAALRVAPSGEFAFDFPEEGLSLEAVERTLIERALDRADGNQSLAARLLGLSRDTLRYRIEKYGLAE